MTSDDALSRCAEIRIEGYDPGLVVNAVNELVPLGKHKALARIEAASSDSEIGLFCVLRVLLDMPPGPGYPPMRLGQPDVAPPPQDALPRFPVVIAADVPLLVVRGYLLGGAPELVASHVAPFREHGSIRSEPLSPSPADAETSFARQLDQAYEGGPPAGVLDWAREQIARLHS